MVKAKKTVKKSKKIGAKALKEKVMMEYEKKGMPKKMAEKIAGGVVRKVGVKKYGAKKFSAMGKKKKMK